MRISDWSSDVCSSDLCVDRRRIRAINRQGYPVAPHWFIRQVWEGLDAEACQSVRRAMRHSVNLCLTQQRSEEHTSELQSLLRISYAVFCLKKKKPELLPPLPHTYSVI